MRPRHHCPATRRGVSTVELLLTSCVAAVLVSAAVPSLQRLLDQSQARADVYEFTEALRLARSEALKRHAEVTVCASLAPLPGQALACRMDANDWSQGWLVFMDGGERGRLDAGDLLIRAYQRPPLAGQVLAGRRNITFQASGLSSWGNGRVRFLPPARGSDSLVEEPLQVVCINKPGRARVVPGPDCSS